MDARMYQTGNQIQSRIADFFFNLLEPGFWTPRHLLKTALDASRQSSHILSYLSSHADGKIVWEEFNNKLQVFSLFRFADSTLNLPPEMNGSLPQFVLRAAELGDYYSVWAIEGLGNYYAGLQMKHGFPEQLLCDASSEMLPSMGLMPLHTGMGLALAESILRAMSEETSSMSRLLHQFVTLCHDNSREGYWGAAFEALGLVARNLYPHLIASIDSDLRQNEDLLGYFWHGIGRGVYFVPVNFIPSNNAPWMALDMCLHEPPHEIGKNNAVAGLTWALALVNMRQPEIIAAFLQHHEKDIGEGHAVANGICSAMIIWRDSAPNDHCFREFIRYEPDPSLSRAWKRLVKNSCDLAFHYYPVLKAQRRLGELFRYQNIHELSGATNNSHRQNMEQRGI